jgi:stage V sporulation protein D (sporulation-specific penicillin-binding protein)
VKPNRWTEYTTSVLAMGHGVAVTTLQMANAFAAIANGGTLLRPRVVLGYVDADGRLISHRNPDVIGRAMMESSVDSLQSFLRGVVEHGTATDVNSDVITIAGKTGTAELVDTETGRIIKNRFMASFGGFFPVDQPKIAGFVVLRDPRPITYGGHTSGPAFRKIAERYLVVNPDLFSVPERQLVEHDRDDEQTVDIPDLIGRDVGLARSMADDRGLKLRASATEGMVVWQFPPADRLVFAGDEVFVHVQPTGAESPVPDLTGLDVRTASAYLHYRGVPFRITGTGHVVQQTPGPGDSEPNEQLWLLTCRPG